jgi:hypothetical protein
MFKKSSALIATFLVYISHTMAQSGMTTTDFQNRLTTCAAGQNIIISGDLLGSITSIYEHDATQGLGVMKNVGALLELIPENQRLVAYELYLAWIERMFDEADEEPRAERLISLVRFGFAVGRLSQLNTCNYIIPGKDEANPIRDKMERVRAETASIKRWEAKVIQMAGDLGIEKHALVLDKPGRSTKERDVRDSLEGKEYYYLNQFADIRVEQEAVDLGLAIARMAIYYEPLENMGDEAKAYNKKMRSYVKAREQGRRVSRPAMPYDVRRYSCYV